ncbi:MAG: hypothetical protein QOG80_2772 [Pseudonocardiales bacterium]|jgi:hypothetical protein|nr:hypothetical protein [Pseudonocardiales bacterium]
MNTIFITSLAEDRRRTLLADAIVVRQARAARRTRSGRRARSGAEAARPAARRYRVRPVVAFQTWVASGQL